MKTIYFCCTGNSCRRQIAEAYGRVLLEGYEVHSAGIEAHGLNPHAVAVMEEDGIDISNQESSLIQTDILHKADLVITLCGDARDNCPYIPPHIDRDHWGFPDPAQATGTEEEIMETFRSVRDEIKSRIIEFNKTGK